MSAATSIQWTDKTWNPVTGCDKVSPGCAHCYAEGVAERFWASQYPPIVVPTVEGETARQRVFTDVQTHEDRLLEPLSWRKPARVFVNSMSDLFHDAVDYDFIIRVFAVMVRAHRHSFQILTKRAGRMREIVAHPSFHSNVSGCAGIAPIPWPLRNVWLGVSVENQHFADERIPQLLQTPAAIRFLSCEPLLGPIDLMKPIGRSDVHANGVDWVIVGGESGPKARSFDLAWGRSIVEQCQAAGVPVFYKQGGASNRCRHDSKGGCLECIPQDLRIREFPHAS